MARVPLPEDLDGIDPTHHGQPMKITRRRITWEGKDSVTWIRWVCLECDLRVLVEARVYDPPDNPEPSKEPNE